MCGVFRYARNNPLWLEQREATMAEVSSPAHQSPRRPDPSGARQLTNLSSSSRSPPRSPKIPVLAADASGERGTAKRGTTISMSVEGKTLNQIQQALDDDCDDFRVRIERVQSPRRTNKRKYWRPWTPHASKQNDLDKKRAGIGLAAGDDALDDEAAEPQDEPTLPFDFLGPAGWQEKLPRSRRRRSLEGDPPSSVGPSATSPRQISTVSEKRLPSIPGNDRQSKASSGSGQNSETRPASPTGESSEPIGQLDERLSPKATPKRRNLPPLPLKP